MTDVSEGDLVALIRAAGSSVVRLEGRPVYRVGGAEAQRFAAWQDGRPRPERSTRTDPYLRLVAHMTDPDGPDVAWERLRLIGDPPSEYEEFQLLGYAEAQAVGERVRVAPRPDAWSGPDAWLIDWERAVLLHYDRTGAPTGMELVESVASVHRIVRTVEWVRRQSITLAEYVAPRVPRRVAG